MTGYQDQPFPYGIQKTQKCYACSLNELQDYAILVNNLKRTKNQLEYIAFNFAY
jgi:hypothetical protein